MAVKLLSGFSLSATRIFLQMGIGEAFEEIRKEKGISQKKLAMDLGMKPQSLNKLLRGRVKDPGIQLVARLAESLGVTVDYALLRAWKGDPSEWEALMALGVENGRAMFLRYAEELSRRGDHAGVAAIMANLRGDPRDEPPDDLVRQPAEHKRNPDSRLLIWDEVPPEEFVDGEWDYTQTWRGGKAPVREGLSAGEMDDFDQTDETTEVLNPTLRDVQSGRFGVTRVRGRSMEPRLHDGDLVLIDTFDKAPKAGRIMAIYQRGKGGAFGYLHKSGDTWLLAKANAAEFSPVVLSGEFMIRGVVKKRLEEDLE